MLGAEAARKLEKRVTRRIEGSGLREHKSLEAFDWAFQPALDKASITELAQLDFVRRRDDLVITGKRGTGKSHILMALGRRACEHQISVRYARCIDLLDDRRHGDLGPVGHARDPHRHRWAELPQARRRTAPGP